METAGCRTSLGEDSEQGTIHAVGLRDWSAGLMPAKKPGTA